jgi:ketosteroid isomerase-like protein
VSDRADVDQAAVTALYEEWFRAVGENDLEALERLFDPVYSYTSPLGQRLARHEILAVEMRLPAPQWPLLYLTVEQLTTDVFIARGGHRLQGDFPADVGGAELAERIRDGIEIAFTSVWRRDGDRWRVVSNDAHIVSAQ